MRAWPRVRRLAREMQTQGAMIRARASCRSLFAVAPLLVAAACHSPEPAGDSAGDSAGESDTDTGGSAAVELCPESASPPAFAVLDAGVSAHRVGACGHVLYRRGGEVVLASPDLASREVLVGATSLGQFSGSGHLVAWETSDGVTIRDLRDGSEHHEASIGDFGFVPSAEPEVGARLWGCRGGVLGAVDFGVGFRALDAEAICDAPNVVAAGAGPLLVYGAGGDRLRSVDIDDGEVVTLDVEHRHSYAGGGSRVDTIEVSSAGDLVVHERIWVEAPPDIDTEIEHHEGSTLLAARSGEALRTTPGSFRLREARAAGLPAVVVGGGEAWGVDAALSLSPIPSGLDPRALLEDKRHVLVHDGAGLGRYDLEAKTLEAWLPGASDGYSASALSPDGASLAARVDTAGCVEDPNTGECSLTISELRVAREGSTKSVARFIRGLRDLALGDHGIALVATSLLTEPAPSEVAVTGVFVIGEEGEVLAQWLTEPGLPGIRALARSGDRFVAAIQGVDGSELVHVDAKTGAASVLVPAVSFDLALDLGRAGDRAFFLDRMSQTLYAGALP